MSLPAWVRELAPGAAAVTIGKFDGVHLGHRAILERVKRLAAERGLEPVVVTFDRHPQQLLDPEHAPRLLLSTAQQRAALAELGLTQVVTIPFDAETASMPPESFVTDALLDGLGARLIVAGSDFRFGKGGRGDAALLERMSAERGVEVIIIDDVCDEEGRRISSTGIRDALAEGRIADAIADLGRPPQLRATVVHGNARGRDLGFPTANLGPDIEGAVPADGIYAGWATVPAGRFPAAISIGSNPTFDGTTRTVEAFLLGVDLDLYGERITLDIIERVRPTVRFESIDALVATMHDDVAQVGRILH